MKTKVNNINNKMIGKARKHIVAWALLCPAMICIYFFIIRPQVFGITWSFFNMKGYQVLEFVGFENYKRVLTDTRFLQTLWNTVQYVFWSVVIGYPIPILIALLLNEVAHCRNWFRIWVYFPNILPSVSVLLLFSMLYYPDSSGLLNLILSKFGIQPYEWLQDSTWTILYIIVAMTWNGAGGTALYYFAAMQGVSRELYEAAVIDGAGFIRRFWTVTFPHIAGILLLFLVKQIMGVFSVMEPVMVLTDGGPNGASSTLGLLLYKYGFESVRPQLSMAVGVIMFLILMVTNLFYFKLDKKVNEMGDM